mmetsp:Transcript_16391/g.43308  ORF Transcript_16391/g.43308 Transcript_16391/m.43308 type:complete len:281 (+) Transcript_16391:111-953(+)
MLSRRAAGNAMNFFNRSHAICWSTLIQSPTQRASQLASLVDAKSTKSFGVMGIVAYSNRQAISNLHMSVKCGRSTEVAKSMSQTASRASIMMFAALRSPCASPTSGQSSRLSALPILSSSGTTWVAISSFRFGISLWKYFWYSDLIACSGGYSPLALQGLNLLSLPLRYFACLSQGATARVPLMVPPFLRSEDTMPPGPKVSARTLFTFPNGRPLTSSAFFVAVAGPTRRRRTCSLSYRRRSLKVDRRLAEPWASSGTFQHAPASSRRMAPNSSPSLVVA